MFQVKGEKLITIEHLNSVKKADFNTISEELQRNPLNCFRHWRIQIVPILKSHILDLPQNLEWKKKFLEHIIDKKIKNRKTIDYALLEREMFPGQTTNSIKRFACNCDRKWMNNKNIVSTEAFDEMCKRRLNDLLYVSSLQNETKDNLYQNYVEDILEVYNSLVV